MLPDQQTDSNFDADGMIHGVTDETSDQCAALVADDSNQDDVQQHEAGSGNVDLESILLTSAEEPRVETPALTDRAIVSAAIGAPDGDIFRRLWSGDTSGCEDDREALTQLAYLLAPHANHDLDRVWDVLDRQSALAEKATWWKENCDWPGTERDGVVKSVQVVVDALRRHQAGTGRDGTGGPGPVKSGVVPLATAGRRQGFVPAAPVGRTGQTDDVVIAAAMAADGSGLVREAWRGDATRFADIRIAREGFCAAVARECGGDVEQVKRLLNRSKVRGLMDASNRLDVETHSAMEKGIQQASRPVSDTGAFGWEPPLAFSSTPTVPAFPVECLPSWLREFVAELSTALQVPADLVAVPALAGVGAALARKYTAVPRQGWQEPLNLFACCVAAVGERKSAVHRAIVGHIHGYEAQFNKQQSPHVNAVLAQRQLLESQLEGLKARARKVKAEDADALQADMTQLREKVDSLQDVRPLRATVGDVTQEALMKILAEQDGRIFQISPEGGPFEVMRGRYSEKENFEVYLHGHAGDDIAIDRITREVNKVRHPALSVSLMVQPDVIRGIVDSPAAAGRGLLARFLYAWPQSKVGNRQVAAAPAKEITIATFDKRMTWLWNRGTNAKDYNPTALFFSPEADELLQEFERWLEPKLDEGGECGWMAGWGNKLAGHAVRIAAGLHFCDLAAAAAELDDAPGTHAASSPPVGAVSAETAARAIKLAKEYFLPHAVATLGVMGADKRLEKAKRVVEEIRQKWKQPKIKPSDVMRISGRVFGSADEAEKVLQLLANHNYVQPESDRGRLAGKAYKRPDYLLNPLAFPLT